MNPTVGRIVHFYPGSYHKAGEFKNVLNGADFLPAIITQVLNEPGHDYSDMINLAVVTPFNGVIGIGSVREKEKSIGFIPTENSPKSRYDDNSYWVWPPKV